MKAYEKLAPKVDEMYSRGITQTQIAEELGVSVRTVRRSVAFNKFKKESGDGKPEPYVVVDNSYEITVKGEKKTYLIKEIDDVFKSYSKFGLNWTAQKTRVKFKLTPYEWNAFKNTFGLVKDSDVFSPYTEENTPREHLDALYEEVMNEKYENKYDLLVEKDTQRSLKEVKKKIDKEHMFNMRLTELENTILSSVTPIITVSKPKVKVKNNNHIVLHIADLHGGAKCNEKGYKYSVQIMRDSLDHIAKRANNYNASKVTVSFLGDLIESFSGLNHLDSWKTLEPEMWGDNILFVMEDVICEFLSKINNLHQVVGVCGNHDRTQDSRTKEIEGYAGMIIYKLIARRFDLPVDNFSYRHLHRKIDGIDYIWHHGDGRMGKVMRKNPLQVINELDINSNYTCLLTGHTHEYKVNASGRNYISITAPAVMVSNKYSQDCFYNSLSGALVTQNNGRGIVEHHQILY